MAIEQDAGCTWPEQDAINQFFSHSNLLPLKKAVTAYRIEVQSERDALRAEVERLRALLRLFNGHACKCAHHAKKDQHPIGTPCPIEQRICAALRDADAENRKHFGVGLQREGGE